MALEYKFLSQVRRPENKGGVFCAGLPIHTNTRMLPIRVCSSNPCPGTHCLGQATRWLHKGSNPQSIPPPPPLSQIPHSIYTDTILVNPHHHIGRTLPCLNSISFPFLFFSFSFFPSSDSCKHKNPHKTLSKNRHLSGPFISAEIYGGGGSVSLSLPQTPSGVKAKREVRQK